MRSQKIRWQAASLAAALLFGIQAFISLRAGETTNGVIFAVLSILFLVTAYAYFRGYIK